MNGFVNTLNTFSNFTSTENGALARKSTGSKVYDLFAMGGAFRNRSDDDVITLFKQAYDEDPSLALKCLFYLRDVRGGQGERRFFRTAFRWLCRYDKEAAKRNLEYVSEYGRWDDLIYIAVDTPIESDAFAIVKKQLALDMESETPSLLCKWLPSENASSKTTRRTGSRIRTYLGMTHKQYRKVLSIIRDKINIIERLMSENRWDEIEFDKIPSKAGLVYRNALARRDILAKKYEAFMKDKDTKVNADALYPYEIVNQALQAYRRNNMDETQRAAINKYWENQKDYLNGAPCKICTVVDTSGSMTRYNDAAAPINIAIGLGMYCAERIGGDFNGKYISFSSRPQWIDINSMGYDFVSRVRAIYNTNLCENTNLEATLDLVKVAMKKSDPKDWPTSLVIISDLEIDRMSVGYRSKDQILTDMEAMRIAWEKEGLTMPKIYYWCVDSRHPVILDAGPGVSFVSGASPVLFEQILRGVSGHELMLDKLLSERYEPIH